MDKNDFLNYLCFKYFILNYSADEIVELIDNFNSDEPYEMFYDLIVATSDVDPDFFVIDDSIIDKIQTVRIYDKNKSKKILTLKEIDIR